MRNGKKTVLYLTLALLIMVSTMLTGATATLACSNETDLTANVSVEMSWLRTFDWGITKSVTPAVWDLFTGDTGTSQYTVSVVKDQGIDTFTVHGAISVTNAGEVPTEGLQIYATLTAPPSTVPLAEFPVDVGAHQVLAPGETWSYPYSIGFSGTPLNEYKVLAKITIMNYVNQTGIPFGPNAKNYVYSPSQPTTVNDVINVDDGGFSWTFGNSGSEDYTRTFSGSDAGTVNNTATIRETGRSASASVTVNSYDLNVSKTADPSLTRKYSWSIDKTGDQTSMTLSRGQTSSVNYTVALTASYADSSWRSGGKISIHNPAPIPAEIVDVSDILSPDVPLELQGLTLPLTIPGGGSVEFNYACALPDNSGRINTATIELQNHDYNFDNTSAPSGTTSFTASAAIDFSSAEITEIDRTVTVTDNKYGPLGTITYSNAITPYNYSLPIGPYAQIGNYSFTNTASFVTGDTHTQGSDSWTVTINVPGVGTRTIGYWKTHPDKMLGLLPVYLGTKSGTKSVAVQGSAKAVDILSMEVYGSPSNGITKLYAQLLAAKLNIGGGADSAAVDSTIAAADSFLAGKNHTDWINLSNSQKELVLGWMTTLDNYNNGLIGPGHAAD